ncbi:hypothetical protein Slin15195_G071080 [Septoria linicola]|uniref:DUF5648 domain-containing protein n=1 Tax=Septoria linicola TaxID=215465 RepID=A0A9Q9EKZ5_9PEZI|nr:hypothetical protein Slin15195_G071080 [Septoria linicola]
MKYSAILAALSASIAAAQRSTVRHFYTPDPNGEYARQVGFTGANTFWGYGLSSQLPGTVPMYRCRQVQQNQYLLTTDAGCEGAPGYVLEGNVMFIYTSQVPGTQPLDRYVNREADHMYVRRDWYPQHPQGYSCDALYGAYVGEGVTGYIRTEGGEGTLPLYVFYQGRHSDRDQCAGNP